MCVSCVCVYVCVGWDGVRGRQKEREKKRGEEQVNRSIRPTSPCAYWQSKWEREGEKWQDHNSVNSASFPPSFATSSCVLNEPREDIRSWDHSWTQDINIVIHFCTCKKKRDLLAWRWGAEHLWVPQGQDDVWSGFLVYGWTVNTRENRKKIERAKEGKIWKQRGPWCFTNKSEVFIFSSYTALTPASWDIFHTT